MLLRADVSEGGSCAENKKIPTNDILKACQDLFYADIVVRTEIGIRTLVDRKRGLRSRTNIVDEDRRSRPQGRVEEAYLRVPLAQHLAGRHTRTVETTASEAPVQDEQRKTWTGTPAARQRAMWRRSPTPLARRSSDLGTTRSREKSGINW